MKKPIFIANWKATKTIKETSEWVNIVKPNLPEATDIDIVVCPPFNSLGIAEALLQGTNIKIGAQDVSKFRKGAYTGEVTVEMLENLVSYCIIGHSERRRYFGETDDDVIEKINHLLDAKITPILCVSDLVQLDSYIQRGKRIIEEAESIVFVYEPPGAISGGGSYKPEGPDKASENAGKISEKIGKKVSTLYGGSVNPENVKAFFSKENIDGGLVGQASVDPQTFLALLKASN